jgi:diguanylate cyclase (GGDEF)-like protein
MPHFLIVEPTETMLQTLADALHRVDIGIILLNRDMRARFINRRQTELFELSPALLATGPHFRDMLAYAAAKSWFAVPPEQLAEYVDQRVAAVLAGSIAPTRINLADGRQLLFSCRDCPDGGRVLTYADISHELKREAEDATDHMRAELRFNTETLEDQGAYLATLAEAADESAKAVEVARLELETEITERRHLETELRRLATTDGLTGVLNRSAFMAAGQHAMEQFGERAGQFGNGFAVLMIDVDHFKAVNDQFGHAGGDLALQHLVATLRSGIRDNDLLGRLGGEEFGIVLTGASAAVADEVAQRLRSRVEAGQLKFDEKMIGMTISAGLAMRLDLDRTIDQIIARADAALYQAKHRGRNRVVVHASPIAA